MKKLSNIGKIGVDISGHSAYLNYTKGNEMDKQLLLTFGICLVLGVIVWGFALGGMWVYFS